MQYPLLELLFSSGKADGVRFIPQGGAEVVILNERLITQPEGKSDPARRVVIKNMPLCVFITDFEWPNHIAHTLIGTFLVTTVGIELVLTDTR